MLKRNDLVALVFLLASMSFCFTVKQVYDVKRRQISLAMGCPEKYEQLKTITSPKRKARGKKRTGKK